MKIHQLEQGTDEWFALRKGRLTASSYDKVISVKKAQYVELLKHPDKHAVNVSPRATKQWEVLEQLTESGSILKSELNASGVSGLLEKDGVIGLTTKETCSINIEGAHKHIDALLADIWYQENDLQPHSPSFAMERGTRLEEVARIDFEIRKGIEVQEVGFVTNEQFGDHIGCSPDGLVDGGNGGLEIKCPLPATHLKYHREGVLPKEYRAQVHGCMAVCDADYWWFTSFCPNISDFTLLVYKDDYTSALSQALKEFNSLFAERLNETKHLAQG